MDIMVTVKICGHIFLHFNINRVYIQFDCWRNLYTRDNSPDTTNDIIGTWIYMFNRTANKFITTRKNGSTLFYKHT